VRIPLVDLAAQHRRLAPAIRAAIEQVLADGQFVRGPHVAAFEAEFASYCGVAHAVGVGTGTDALHLALRALDVGGGDAVVTVPNTFAATASAVLHSGASLQLVDADPKTWMLDPARLTDAVRADGSVRAVVPVHLYGHVADVDAIAAIDPDLLVVEDAAQAHGARAADGRRVGSLGAAAAFSFYPSKNLGALGDGGAVVTGDERVAARVRELADHGRDGAGEHVVVGWNSRLDALQAAVLLVELQHLDEMNAARRGLVARYRAQLCDVAEVRFPEIAAGSEPVHHLLVVAVPDRDDLRVFLAARGIASAVHYPVPLHLQPALRALGYARGDFPVAEGLADSIVSLPLSPALPDRDLDDVAAAVRAFYAAP
jgi:dTDP-4-amino-4,6-dideoxygalactose transaminase